MHLSHETVLNIKTGQVVDLPGFLLDRKDESPGRPLIQTKTGSLFTGLDDAEVDLK